MVGISGKRLYHACAGKIDPEPAPLGRLFLSSTFPYLQVLLEKEDVGRPGTYVLTKRSPDDKRWKDIAALLSRKQDTVPPLEALKLLPGEVRWQEFGISFQLLSDVNR